MDVHSPLVSVVIVNYNGIRFLEGCLSSLMKQSYSPVEIILVDNGSSDGSPEMVKDRYPSVRIIENGRNLGFARANNLGIMAANGTLIATLNNDTEVTPGWIEEHVRAMSDDGDVGMTSSKMLSMIDRQIIDSTGLCVSRSGACWDRGQFEPDVGQYEGQEEVFGPCAGAAMYRKKMLDETGLFDEDFFAYMEDVDLAFRGQLAGWKCLYVPRAVVYHYRGGTGGKRESEYPVYYGNRNIIWCPLKNFPLSLLVLSAPWIMTRNMAVIPYYAVRGLTVTILRSKLDAIIGLPRMLKKRTKGARGKDRVRRFIRTRAELPVPGKKL